MESFKHVSVGISELRAKGIKRISSKALSDLEPPVRKIESKRMRDLNIIEPEEEFVIESAFFSRYKTSPEKAGYSLEVLELPGGRVVRGVRLSTGEQGVYKLSHVNKSRLEHSTEVQKGLADEEGGKEEFEATYDKLAESTRLANARVSKQAVEEQLGLCGGLRGFGGASSASSVVHSCVSSPAKRPRTGPGSCASTASIAASPARVSHRCASLEEEPVELSPFERASALLAGGPFSPAVVAPKAVGKAPTRAASRSRGGAASVAGSADTTATTPPRVPKAASVKVPGLSMRVTSPWATSLRLLCVCV